MSRTLAAPGRLAARLIGSLRGTDRTELVLLLSLLVFLLHHLPFWFLTGPLTALMGAGLIWPRLRAHPLLWLPATGLLGFAASRQWYTIDNHQYLFVYWSMAVLFAACLDPEDRRRGLARSGAWLVGATMALATVQKLASPDYVDGSFFEYTLLTDQRFASFTAALGGVSLDQLAENRAFEAKLALGASRAVTLIVGEQGRWLATLAAWGILVMEGTLALLFLWPRASDRLRAVRSGVLLAFVLVTYPVAPVTGFGRILITMTLAQLPERCERLWVTFLVLFLVLPLFSLALGRMVAALDLMGT
jgi:hypothetical protein